MRKFKNPYIEITIAVVAILLATGIWYYLIRPVPEELQNGIVEKIEFFEKEKVEKTEVRTNGSGNKERNYTMPNRFIYSIRLNNGKKARYQEIASHTKIPDYKIGTKLLVKYQFRELPFGYEDLSVLEIESLDKKNK